jgi:hypothetical protein
VPRNKLQQRDQTHTPSNSLQQFFPNELFQQRLKNSFDERKWPLKEQH